jgi:hypothetical protein
LNSGRRLYSVGFLFSASRKSCRSPREMEQERDIRGCVQKASCWLAREGLARDEQIGKTADRR